jgi:FkbM family methyltransferase
MTLSSAKYMLRNLGRRLRWRPSSRPVRERVMGINLEYDPTTAIGKRLYFRAAFEQAEIDFCSDLLATISNPVVLDIGANIGVHSLCWSARHQGLRSHLFEPSPRTAAALKKNIALNSVEDRLTVHQVALSNASGEASFFECEDSAFSSLRNTGRNSVTNEVKVPVTTLDEWAATRALDKIDLVKIDVEGLEHNVISGARTVLSSYRPHLFVEIFGGERSNPDPEGTVELVRSLGYEAFTIGKDSSLTPYTKHSDQRYNYYFRPQ